MAVPAGRRIVLALCLAVASVACAATGTPPTTSPSVSYPSPVVASAPPAATYHGTLREPPIRVRPFALTDQRGERFRVPQDLHGAVALLYFGYTHCPDICPGTLAAIAVALRELPPSVRSAVDVVFVTVDPARDTPAALASYLGLFSDRFIGLTGSAREIERALARFGFPPPIVADLGGGEYVVGHPAGVLAITPDRRVHLEYPFDTSVDAYVQDLTRLVEEGWRSP
jgi:protein SCO1/2